MSEMAPGSWVVWTLSAIGVYFLVLGYFRTEPKSVGNPHEAP